MGRKRKGDTVIYMGEEAGQNLLNGTTCNGYHKKNFKNEQKKKQGKDKGDKHAVECDGEMSKKNKTGSTWKGFATKVKQIWPFMWPKGNVLLQVRVIACCAILVTQRVVNIALPVLYKLIVDSLSPSPVAAKSEGIEVPLVNDSQYVRPDAIAPTPGAGTNSAATTSTTVEFRWDLICLFMLVKAFQGGSGYLNILRSFLWLTVAQNTQKQMRLRLFSHLHHLSMRWHVSRKTGEVIRIMDRGVTSITMVLNHVLFNIFPVIFDVILAIIFFVTVFNVWTGLIVFATMAGYLACTISISEWRTKFRRSMNEADNKKNAASVDSILNFETVKYYSAEDWETARYEEAIDKHQEKEWKVNATANLLNFAQKTLMILGLLGGSLFCAWYVYKGKFTVGDYVMFATYVEQLYVPLNMFGAYYRILQNAFVDMENMFEMLEEKEDVKDAENASQLVVEKGNITFENVSFYYHEKEPVLRNISFKVPAGHTYALVGDSGEGKSTVIRLLFRFYDIQHGRIKIDDQDISMVTQKSLRQQIGVVPQDAVLFNQDIRYNIRYGRVTATDADIEEAAKAANIHDKILTFHDGYDSRVGEKGLKVSGGEKQRIAIARTILKGPEIVLLDEATSALDTRTERHIQESLKKMCEGKTTIVVAHRLSTVIHAHQILVIHKGRIVEQGTHEELLRIKGGHYNELWMEQLQNKGNKEELLSCTCCQAADTVNDVSGCTCTCHEEQKVLKRLVSERNGDEEDGDEVPVHTTPHDVTGVTANISNGIADAASNSGHKIPRRPKTIQRQHSDTSSQHHTRTSVPSTKLTAEREDPMFPPQFRERAHTHSSPRNQRFNLADRLYNRQMSVPSLKYRQQKIEREQNEKERERAQTMMDMSDNREFAASVSDLADLEVSQLNESQSEVLEAISSSNVNLLRKPDTVYPKQEDSIHARQLQRNSAIV